MHFFIQPFQEVERHEQPTFQSRPQATHATEFVIPTVPLNPPQKSANGVLTREEGEEGARRNEGEKCK